jgi:hypothetical protein
VITVNQAGKLDVAIHLKAARDELAQTLSSAQWKNEEFREISDLMTQIDKLFGQLIPNNKRRLT